MTFTRIPTGISYPPCIRGYSFKQLLVSGTPPDVNPDAVKAPLDFHTRRAARLMRLKLSVADFEESFSRSSGPGGQHVNKVSTAVTLRHAPTGAAVTVQDSRSQAMNRQLHGRGSWTPSKPHERPSARRSGQKSRKSVGKTQSVHEG